MEPETIDTEQSAPVEPETQAAKVDRLRAELEAEGTPPKTAHTIVATYVMVSEVYEAFMAFGSSPLAGSLLGKGFLKKIGKPGKGE